MIPAFALLISGGGSGGGYPAPVWPAAPTLPAVSNLIARYRAEALSLSDGAAVSPWADESGNAYNLVQATSGRRPTYRATWINGLPAVEFDSIDDALQKVFGTTYTQPNTIFMLCSLPSGGTTYADAYPWIDGGSATDRNWMGHTTVSNRGGVWSGTAFISGTIPLAEGAHMFRGLFSGASSAFSADGFLESTGNSGTQGLGGVTLGARYDLARNTKVLINEVLIYNKAPTTAEILEIERYFALKIARAPIVGRGSFGTSNKWAYGCRSSSNGHIYAAPFQNTQMLKINTTTGSVASLGSYGGGADSWIGVIEAPNGYIYAVPGGSFDVLKIDPATDTATTFSRGDTDGKKYYGGALADNGKIYFCPFDSTKVKVLNPATDTIYDISGVTFTNTNASGQWGWFVKGVDGKLYACPRYDNRILVVDPATDTLSYISAGVLAGDRKFCGGVVGANGDIYFVPRSATTCMALNTSSGVARTFGTLAAGTDKWTWGIASGPYVIMIPRYQSTDLLVIDTRNDSVHFLPSLLNQTDKFVGAVDGGDGNLYLIPYASPQVGVIKLADLPS